MILRLQSLFAGLLALLVAALLALGSASAKPASGGYQLFEPVALEHQQHIQLSSLENFDYHARIASECCNATNRTDDFMGGGDFRSGDVVVQHRENVIALGDDVATMGNFRRAPDFGDDVQTVVVHGNRDGTFNINGQDVPASTVAELIQSAPNHNPNSTIFLGSCHSGFCSPQVGAEGAQLLSNITGQPVIAPNVRTRVPSNPAEGSNWSLDQNGSWQTFVPE